MSTQRRRLSIIAGTIGNLVEWFDWNVYAFLTPVIASQFFSQQDKATQILSTLIIFAIGFLFRPLGGAVLGSYADRHGRRAGMTLTIVLMALGSLAIAAIPSYHQIGVAAPVLLFLARSVQGFSAGGEFGTSSAYLVENAAPGKRATTGAWQQVSVGGGTLLASITAMILFRTLSPADLASWGWRLAFLAGGVLGLVGLWLRLRAEETLEYAEIKRRHRVQQRPLLQALRAHPVAALRVVGMVAAGTALVQFWYAAYPTFLLQHLGVPMAKGQLAASIGLAVFTVLVPFMGRLADRVGRRPLQLFFALGSAVTIAPLLLNLERVGIIAPIAVSSVFLAAYAGSLAAMMSEQFPAEVRTAGISVPYGIAVAVFGGLTLPFASAMAAKGTVGVLAVVMAVLALASAVVFFTMEETRSAAPSDETLATTR